MNLLFYLPLFIRQNSTILKCWEYITTDKFLYNLAVIETIIYWLMVWDMLHEKLKFGENTRKYPDIICGYGSISDWVFVALGLLLLSCLSTCFSKETAWVLKILGLANLYFYYPVTVLLLFFYFQKSIYNRFGVYAKNKKVYLILIFVLFLAIQIDSTEFLYF